MSQEYLNILKERSFALSKVRSFFSNLGFIEVDPPYITKKPSIDEHIDLMKTDVINKERGYLHSSPEYMMKRLLSFGLDKIYFLGHVFRKDELGKIHNPEFTMIEWYKKNCSFETFINEVLHLIFLFLGEKKIKKISYRNLLIEYSDIDYTKASKKDLKNILEKNKISISENIKDIGSLLNLIVTHIVEPKMKNDIIYVIYDYPKSQAALAQTHTIEGIEVAERFEVYFNQIELANGFHELTRKKSQKIRFLKINEKRKEKLEIDETFLSILKNIGDCYGIAVGFDRLFMLEQKKNSIKEIIPFSWDNI